ncbi:MAG: hypothetical protein AAGC82_10610 [Pseudomonadota bacterium]
MDVLEEDIAATGYSIDAAEWTHARRHMSEINVRAGSKILSQARIADQYLFVASGVAASEQTWETGATSIARFFERGQICSNFTSAWNQQYAADDLLALTDVTGVSFSDTIMRGAYLEGGTLGKYLRVKAMQAHLFTKEVLCAKTHITIEPRYAFLEHFHDEVLGRVQQKDIARFLGVTPQGLCRFLRRRKCAAD